MTTHHFRVIVKLEPKTLKGKTRIAGVRHQFGLWDSTWEILETSGHVLFSNEKGPWLFLSPKVDVAPFDVICKFSRWVHSTADTNFFVVRQPQVIDKLAYVW